MVESGQKDGIKSVQAFRSPYRHRLARAMCNRSYIVNKSSHVIGDCAMHPNPSKLCADHLRATLYSSSKLKASHARELAAAYFGYKSHASLLADGRYPIDCLPDASILIPDVPLLSTRVTELKGLPGDLPTPIELAKTCSEAISGDCFGGEIWLYDSLENYLMEVLLIRDDGRIQDCLSGVMAETNAYFDDAYYDHAETSDDGDIVAVSISGVYSGENHPDRLFCGDRIDMKIEIELYRCAGRRGFTDFDLSATGEINDDWVDPELRFGSASG